MPLRRSMASTVLWVGHFDLSVSLGIPGQFDHPKFLKAIERTVAATKKHKKSLGRLVPTTELGIALYKQGFDFCCYSGDVWVLRDALTAGHEHLARGLQAMTGPFRVALSGDFRKADGTPVYPGFRSGAAQVGARRRDGVSRFSQPAARRPA